MPWTVNTRGSQWDDYIHVYQQWLIVQFSMAVFSWPGGHDAYVVILHRFPYTNTIFGDLSEQAPKNGKYRF